MSDEVCRARLETLTGFAEAGAKGRTEVNLAGRVAAADRDWETVSAACAFRRVEGNPGPELAATLEQFGENEAWVQALAEALADAPAAGGISVLSAAQVAARLAASGAGPDAAEIYFDDQQLLGMPVTSGMVNDPVNAANGNFVHADRDLRFPGFGAVLDVVRVYNSRRASSRGEFGRGWTSPLDMALDIDGGPSVRLRFSDGAEVRFAPDGEGGWRPDGRRRLVLRRAGDGFELSRHQGRRRWFFDGQGVLTGGAEASARWTVSRQLPVADGEGTVTWHEERSGRWVRYERSEGLVHRVSSSDGRACTYRYDRAANCVGVERPGGTVTYEIDDSGFVAAVVDADGVTTVANRYDETGRVVGQAGPHGRRTTFSYLDNGATRIADDSNGPSNLLFHDRHGNLTALFGSDGVAMRAGYDGAGRLVRHEARDGAVTTYEHHPDPLLDLVTARVDPDGGRIERTYDDQGRVVAERTRSGARYRFTYEADNPSPTRIEGPLGAEIVTRYDERYLPRTVTDADGVATGFEWDSDGQLAAHVNGAGERTTLAYDRTGALVAVTGADGRAATFGLDTDGRVVAATDPDGVTTTFAHSAAGRILATSRPGGGSWRATFGDHGDLVAFADASGFAVAFGHDQAGRVTTITGPDGTVTTQTWDGLGLLTSVTDPAGNTATQRHDRAGRPVAVTRYDGSAMHRQVDALGRTVELTGPDGATTTRTYHPDGQLASVTGPDGGVHRFEVDELGRVAAEIGPDSGRHRYEWSPASRLLRATSPAGRVTSFDYDRAGRLVSVTDPDGVTALVDGGPDGPLAAGRGEAVVAGPGPDGVAARLRRSRGDDAPSMCDFDPRGLLTRVVDPAGLVTRFLHDQRGRVVGTASGPSAAHFGYDPSGSLSHQVDGDGLQVRYEHTSAGRLERVLFASDGDGQGDAEADGQRVGDGQRALGRRLELDGAGRLTGIDDLDGRPLAGYRYDPAGRLVAADTPEGAAIVGRDDAGRIVMVTGLDGAVTRYERDPDGLVRQRTGPDGRRTGFRRTPAGRLLGLVDDDAGPVETPAVEAEPGPDRLVSRDRAGRMTVDRHGRIHRYDHAGRLEQTVGRAGAVQEFSWNDLGLLASDSGLDGGDRRRFTYSVAGRLLAVTPDHGPAVSFHYDAAGRRVAQVADDGNRVDYQWNGLDRLVAVTRTGPDGTTSTRRLTWSGLGRVERIDGERIGWDDAHSGKPVEIGRRRYLRSGLWVRPAAPGESWRDGTADDPWGWSREWATGLELGYRGELCVDGLVLMGERVYDPATRVFLSADPLPPRIGATGAFGSAYGYAWCDPVNLVDPSGREPVSIEEFEAWKERQESNRFERAVDAMAEDPWGTLAMVGVVAVGVTLVATGVGGPIGAGILIGAATQAGMGLATDNFNPRSVAIGGAFGAIPGAGAARMFASGVGESVAGQVLVDGRGLDEIDVGGALLSGATGAAVPFLGSRLTGALPAGTADDLVPGGGVNRPSSGLGGGSGGPVIDLYHGSTSTAARSIQSNGIDLAAARPTRDFGPGFYTTNDVDQAENWARRRARGSNDTPAVLHYQVPSAGLDTLEGMRFSDAGADWEALVRSQRAGGPRHEFDVVEGPMVLRMQGLHDGGDLAPGGHQLSLHTSTAIELFDSHLTEILEVPG